MEFNPSEKGKLKSTLTYLVKKKNKESGGHCGFHPVELLDLLDELVSEVAIAKRPTLHNDQYFLTPNTNNDEQHQNQESSH